jgi:hypothetical protein
VSFEPVWLDDANGRMRNPQISRATGEKITVRGAKLIRGDIRGGRELPVAKEPPVLSLA